MDHNLLVLIILTVASIVFYLISWIFNVSQGGRSIRSESKGTPDDFVMVYPAKLLVPSVILLIAGIVVLFVLESTDPFPADAGVIAFVTYLIIVAIFTIAAVICLNRVYRYSIHVQGDRIQVYSGKNVKYSFTFDQIKSVKSVNTGNQSETYKITTTNGHKLRVGDTMISYNLFLKKLRQQCGNVMR
ncbi:MAG: hypothetical protein Q4B70_05505 [Lachnospiraceae bacterium]|nr:hypothetical protein [Lachnospiraceae bacterium]